MYLNNKIKKYNNLIYLLKIKYYKLIKKYRNILNNFILLKSKTNNKKHIMILNIKINHYRIKVIKLNDKFTNLYNIFDNNLYIYKKKLINECT